jgi:hypothetical protein
MIFLISTVVRRKRNLFSGRREMSECGEVGRAKNSLKMKSVSSNLLYY